MRIFQGGDQRANRALVLALSQGPDGCGADVPVTIHDRLLERRHALREASLAQRPGGCQTDHRLAMGQCDGEQLCRLTVAQSRQRCGCEQPYAPV